MYNRKRRKNTENIKEYYRYKKDLEQRRQQRLRDQREKTTQRQKQQVMTLSNWHNTSGSEAASCPEYPDSDCCQCEMFTTPAPGQKNIVIDYCHATSHRSCYFFASATGGQACQVVDKSRCGESCRPCPSRENFYARGRWREY
eukprot:TRINITY_DN32095_c0_g1_i2.p2 TRINITY_DN32095_c0_g1~~TRINITY_DN32095_c0_g1_i2.p2  ORF type:complete len:143 (-),score=20.12 TRINITY_DN32095_c0_g1_i2:269-697(-)